MCELLVHAALLRESRRGSGGGRREERDRDFERTSQVAPQRAIRQPRIATAVERYDTGRNARVESQSREQVREGAGGDEGDERSESESSFARLPLALARARIALYHSFGPWLKRNDRATAEEKEILERERERGRHGTISRDLTLALMRRHRLSRGSTSFVLCFTY